LAVSPDVAAQAGVIRRMPALQPVMVAAAAQAPLTGAGASLAVAVPAPLTAPVRTLLMAAEMAEEPAERGTELRP
jgi:hypothetical protein